MGLFGIEIGPSIDSLASDYANSHKLNAKDFVDKKALDLKLGDMYTECARYVPKQNFLHSYTNSYGPCKQKIDETNAGVIQTLTQQEASEDAQIKAVALAGNSKTFATVAMILIVMVAIVIILR